MSGRRVGLVPRPTLHVSAGVPVRRRSLQVHPPDVDQSMTEHVDRCGCLLQGDVALLRRQFRHFRIDLGKLLNRFLSPVRNSGIQLLDRGTSEISHDLRDEFPRFAMVTFRQFQFVTRSKASTSHRLGDVD